MYTSVEIGNDGIHLQLPVRWKLLHSFPLALSRSANRFSAPGSVLGSSESSRSSCTLSKTCLRVGAFFEAILNVFEFAPFLPTAAQVVDEVPESLDGAGLVL